MRGCWLVGARACEGVHIRCDWGRHGQSSSSILQHEVHDLLSVGDWQILLLHESAMRLSTLSSCWWGKSFCTIDCNLQYMHEMELQSVP